MDDLRILPTTDLNPAGPVSQVFLASGLFNYRQVAELVRNWPYGYPQTPPGSPLEYARLGLGTCTGKHAILAAIAEEVGLPVYKAIGIYPMDSQLVPGIEPLLLRMQVPVVPATHCFLTYEGYRLDLTEGNCNGKQGPVDRYWKVQRISPLPPQQFIDSLYREFLETDLPRFLPQVNNLTVVQWQELKRQCAEVLQLAVACQI